MAARDPFTVRRDDGHPLAGERCAVAARRRARGWIARGAVGSLAILAAISIELTARAVEPDLARSRLVAADAGRDPTPWLDLSGSGLLSPVPEDAAFEHWLLDGVDRRSAGFVTGELAFTFGGDLRSAGLQQEEIGLGEFVAVEQRDAFVRSADVFDFASAGGPAPFVASSVAGPLLAGVRLTGREGPIAFGAMGVQLDGDEINRGPLTVGRVAVDLAEGTRVGVIATAGDPRGAHECYVVGADVTWRGEAIAGQVIEGEAWLQHSRSSRDGLETGADAALGLRLRCPAERLGWELGFTQVGASFDAAMGSVPRRGVRGYVAKASWAWDAPAGGDLLPGIRSIASTLDGELVTDLGGAAMQRRVAVRPLVLETNRADRLHVGYTTSYEVLSEARSGPAGIVLPAGAYAFDRYEVGLSTAPTSRMRVGVTVGAGEFYTGRRVVAGLSTTVQVAPGVDVAVEYQQDDIELEYVRASTDVLRGRVSVALAPGSSMTNEVAYDRAAETTRFSGRLEWSIDDDSRLSVGMSGIVGDEGFASPQGGAIAASVRLTSEF